jgi:hypothetical protein
MRSLDVLENRLERMPDDRKRRHWEVVLAIVAAVLSLIVSLIVAAVNRHYSPSRPFCLGDLWRLA